MNKNDQSHLSDIEISYDSLSEYMRNTFPDRVLIDDDNPNIVNGLIAMLYSRGYKTIDDVYKTVERTKEAIEQYERNNPPDIGSKDSRYSAAGIVKASILILDDDYLNSDKTFLDGFVPKKLKKYQRYIIPETQES
jgi:hypothetical protein